MTPRERFIAALNREPLTGLVPHFELVFFLTMEAFGKVHPNHRSYHQWDQMEAQERRLHIRDMAGLFVATAERYDHSAIFIHQNPFRTEVTLRVIDAIRDLSGDRYFLMIHGDATYSIPGGDSMEAFSYRIVDDAAGLKREASAMVDSQLRALEPYAAHGGLDGLALCSDYCLNTGPFLSPNQFAEFVTPYLARLIEAERAMGFRVIKHTDGNIMPILDQLVQCRPHALHSIDPQAGVDIGEVKRLVGDQVCLIGNVNCGLMDTGTEDEVRESCRYALKHGMPGGGFIFSTSNCIYTGMRLSRYDLMQEVWRQEGLYPGEVEP